MLRPSLFEEVGVGTDLDGPPVSLPPNHTLVRGPRRLPESLEACDAGGIHHDDRRAAPGVLGCMLFDLMREIDECREDIVFFADEAGSWQVGVLWDRVLPPWFRSLSPTTEAYEWAETVVDALNDFAGYQMDDILKAAREAGTVEQQEALAEYEGDLRRRR